ncbi:hypothetical protein Q75_17015 [Bacillus coahuilensis p1.1.43]|uniref:Uncharacterized protein n=1 Tax=Bacillus coahuilensis p1.1.43 TaxID=1150625 RepID=A0A147K3Z2_9BACI|nr:hypothetical protein Q75_17015 [Bacillus coahuilensis p1.1.43]
MRPVKRAAQEGEKREKGHAHATARPPRRRKKSEEPRARVSAPPKKKKKGRRDTRLGQRASQEGEKREKGHALG